ncbi:MAG: hypothetical protein GWP59_08715 [Chlamydiales bacterium]|nr:hypothetical protein [Chlamydiales bacterium]NCF71767.1 hypothetical protein [Chlamydiales bacterium]
MMEVNETYGKTDLTKQIFIFRDFLVASWPYLDDLMDNHDWEDDGWFIQDWLDINWQHLVGREVLGKGNGYITNLSPFSPKSSFMEGPIYSVIAKSRNNEPLLDLRGKEKILNDDDLRLSGFCTIYEEVGFGLYPPFDIATLTMGNTSKPRQYEVELDKLEFHLKEL